MTSTVVPTPSPPTVVFYKRSSAARSTAAELWVIPPKPEDGLEARAVFLIRPFGRHALARSAGYFCSGLSEPVLPLSRNPLVVGIRTKRSR